METLSIIWPCALSIAFVGLLESLLTAKLVDELTATTSSKRRESIGLGAGNILAGLYGGIAGCAMIGQTIVNVEMGKGRSRVSTFAAGMVLLVLVTALSEVMAKSRWPFWPGSWRLLPSKRLTGTAFSLPR